MQSRAREGRLGFVPVRFGDDVIGGAEMLVAEMADGLARRGWAVDVLTGCTRDHFREVGWYAPGTSERRSGVRVHRFPSVASAHRADRVLGNRALDRGLELDRDEQDRWCNDDVRVPGLVEYLIDHAREYRVLVFAPYLYWSTVAGSLVAPERSVIVPCLHDEPAARLAVYDRMFQGSAGLWFLTEPEAEIARALRPALTRHTVIGSGVHVPTAYDPDGFRARFGIEGPFVLYAGRRESAKGFTELVEWFVEAEERARTGLRLVIAGPGRVRVPKRARPHVVDVGPLTRDDRDGALAAAAAVVQPSAHESFSRTMMEAWLAGTPVIANGASAVSRWHCERSNGGFTYRTKAELAACLRLVLLPDAAARAAHGREYVLREYTWPRVLDRVEALIDDWYPAMNGRRPACLCVQWGYGDAQRTNREALRAVVVSPYPPTSDPRGDAALETVRALRAQGFAVVVVSPAPSAARLRARPDTITGALRIARLVAGADRVVLHVMGPPGGTRGLRTAIARAVMARGLARAHEVEVVAHEVPARGVAPDPARVPFPKRARRLASRVRAGGPTLVRTLRWRTRSG